MQGGNKRDSRLQQVCDMRLVLFDVDGTLILTGGAGMRAFSKAMQQVFQIPVNHETIQPDGKTDPLIAREWLANFGWEDRWNERSREAVFSKYLAFLEEEVNEADAHGSVHVLPGVVAILDALASQLDFAVGLVTGNLEEGARIKLEKVGLYDYFAFGGYGSDHEDRTAVVREGMRRGALHIAPAIVEGSFVVGDTPLDIIHAHRAGACAIAVASSNFSVDDLQLHKPDLLVTDLTQVDRILAFMRAWPARQNPH
jgi:phosphoglycolate phosphatase-like HAD superfamily hydrolase